MWPKINSQVVMGPDESRYTQKRNEERHNFPMLCYLKQVPHNLPSSCDLMSYLCSNVSTLISDPHQKTWLTLMPKNPPPLYTHFKDVWKGSLLFAILQQRRFAPQTWEKLLVHTYTPSPYIRYWEFVFQISSRKKYALYLVEAVLLKH